MILFHIHTYLLIHFPMLQTPSSCIPILLTIQILSSSQTVDLVFLYFILIFIFISIYFLTFLFLEHRVRVSNSHESRDAWNEVEGSRTNDVIQHGYCCGNHLLQRQMITQAVNLLNWISSEKFTRELDTLLPDFRTKFDLYINKW